jgi:hypothetical protein
VIIRDVCEIEQTLVVPRDFGVVVARVHDLLVDGCLLASHVELVEGDEGGDGGITSQHGVSFLESF